MVIGVNDNGNVIGVDLQKETLQGWLNEIKTKTQPFLLPDAEETLINKRKVVVLDVTEFPMKPVAFKGRYFIRKGNSNHIMSSQDISEMYLRTRNSSWDFFPDKASSMKELDKSKIKKARAVVEGNLGVKFGSDIAFLRKYSLIAEEKGKAFPTFASILLFSDKWRSDIQIGLFQEPTVIKKNKIIRDDLISEVGQVMDFLQSYMLKEFVFTGKPQREERWQYPIEALREFVINAIIHRDYREGTHSQFKVFPDRIELWNSGTLPYGLTIEEIVKGTKKSHPRNKLIAEVFRDSGLIERYGSGVRRAIDRFKGYGLPTPVVREDAGGFEVVCYGKKREAKEVGEGLSEGLSEGLKSLLELILASPGIKAKSCSEKLKRPIKTIERQIKELRKNMLIERRGSRKTGGYYAK